jgi:hypothetical protein
MKPDSADSFARPLSNVEEGFLLRVEVESLPGPSHGPAGMATREGVVVEVLKDSGDPDSPGRYFRRLLFRNGDREADYRLDYRGYANAEAWFQKSAGTDAFSESEEWGPKRRVYAVEIDGQGVTTRRERPGHSFLSVGTDDETDDTTDSTTHDRQKRPVRQTG